MRFSFGEYELDTEARTLLRAGKQIRVQAKVLDLLAYLIEHRDRVVSTDELFRALWPNVIVGPAALSRAVHKAREAVDDDGEHQTVIHTEHGRGFRFVAEVTDLAGSEEAPSKPARVRIAVAALAGVVAMLLVAAAVWLLIRPLTESAPARSVGVLPFENMSRDAASEPFANGIYDDILTQIARIRDLKVIARATMERIDPNLGMQAIGTQLGVAAVLAGGVQRSGDRVRINVQLIDCKTEAHLWAETYDRELTAANIFAIQSEIATSVANALQATLSADEEDRLATVPTENLAAYDAYLLGKQRMAKRTIVALPEAIEYFHQAINLDPAFALAYVGLADSYRLQFEYADRPMNETLMQAQVAATKALELDSRLPEAYTSLGGINHMRGNFEIAEREFRRALQLGPGYGQAYHWYGVMLREELDRSEEALSMFLRAAELDPLSALIMTNVGNALGSLGRFEECLAWYQRSLSLDPNMVVNIQDIGRYHWNVTGKLDQAVVWLTRANSLDPASPRYPAMLALIFLTLGDPATATYWSDRAIELGPNSLSTQLAKLTLQMYRSEQSAFIYARKAFSNVPLDSPLFNGRVLLVFRDNYLRAGRYSEARSLYEEAHPELFNEGEPQVNFRNWNVAIELAVVLFKTGEQERANLLLEKSLQHIRSKPRLGDNGFNLADVKIYAIRGDRQKALLALRQAIDEGWRAFWWYDLKYDPILKSLQDEPEFQEMVAEIEADMAAQLARVREMERNRELEPIPELAAE